MKDRPPPTSPPSLTANHRSPHHFLLSLQTGSLPFDMICLSAAAFGFLNPYLEFWISWNLPPCRLPLFPTDPYIASFCTSHLPFLSATAPPDRGWPQLGYLCWGLWNLCCAKIVLWHRKHGVPSCLRTKQVETWCQRVWKLQIPLPLWDLTVKQGLPLGDLWQLL